MEKQDELFEELGVKPFDVLLPAKGVDMSKFAVIACDQHSAEAEYWQQTQRIAGGSPSALNMILPEAFLDKEENAAEKIWKTMEEYLGSGVLEDVGHGFVYVKRQTSCGIRCGLLAAVDLERYDYEPGAKALIKATEATVKERLPKRAEIRKNAPLETSHVLLLSDDKENEIKKLCERHLSEMKKLYDFELMQNGGRIEGYFPENEEFYIEAAEIFKKLLRQNSEGILWLAGDGNHSLAAAKEHWNNVKGALNEEEAKIHPARFAMVEIVSIYDDGLNFLPIHRLLRNVDPQKLQAEVGFDAKFPPSLQELQPKLDDWLKAHPEAELEYIHGAETCRKLAEAPNCLGIVFKDFQRGNLFEVIAKNGILSRKSFSLGEAGDKRYYIECRKIR